MAKLSQEIEELKEVIEEKKGAHSRLKLEIDNFRQRTKSELATARGKAAIPLVQELLPIADEYEYAKQNLKIESDGQQAVVTKFEALFDKMLQTWKSLGIEKMNSVGEDYSILNFMKLFPWFHRRNTKRLLHMRGWEFVTFSSKKNTL